MGQTQGKKHESKQKEKHEEPLKKSMREAFSSTVPCFSSMTIHVFLEENHDSSANSSICQWCEWEIPLKDLEFKGSNHAWRKWPFKGLYFFLFSQHKTPHSFNTKVQERSGNSTLNALFDVDPFSFTHSVIARLLPNMTCIHTWTNRELETHISYTNCWVRCENIIK